MEKTMRVSFDKFALQSFIDATGKPVLFMTLMLKEKDVISIPVAHRSTVESIVSRWSRVEDGCFEVELNEDEVVPHPGENPELRAIRSTLYTP